ncbi:MAG: hypothetical protein Q8Q09_22160 [Deltaproteobacteria bacterium]|nr:hypothetical protein [Deltaproteobacteria bacterium]
MASSAEWRRYPIYRASPRAAGRRPGERVRLLAWPALLWRALGPEYRQRRLNLFQRAVLGLLLAGRRTAVEISERLVLHRDFVALILVQLASLGLLDASHRPISDRSAKALADDDDFDADLVVGRVVSDPFSGQLWPRFIEREFSVAEVEVNPRGWPEVVSGSAGAPRRESAFVVSMPDPPRVEPPSPDAILWATRQHRRGYDEQERDELPPARLAGAQCLDAEPERALVLLRVRVLSGEWTVDDPVDVGDHPFFQRMIEQRIDDERKRGKSSALSDWLVPPLEDADPTLGALQASARHAAENRLPRPAICGDQGLWERIVAMQRARLEADLVGSPADKHDDVAVKAQQALEHVVAGILREDRHRDDLTRLHKTDEALNKQLYEACAKECGFETPLPKTLVGARAGKVRQAFESRQGSLRPLVLAALLGASARETHPFRLASGRCPTLLRVLNSVASTRDPAAHGGQSPRQQETIDVVEHAYQALEALLPE